MSGEGGNTSSDHASGDMSASTSESSNYGSTSDDSESGNFFNPDDDVFIEEPFRDDGHLLIGEDTSEQLYGSCGLTVNQTLASKQTMTDLHQSHIWKERYEKNGPFKGDPRGICLSLCTDGTNPYSKNKASYSMWPIMLTIFNLPFPCRIRPQSILLAGIIPGKSEPNNLDPYIGILVDEIIQLKLLIVRSSLYCKLIF